MHKRRSAAELAALEMKPLEQRTEEEKEAVRYHRKELKRRKRKANTAAQAPATAAAAPLLVPPAPSQPPPTRSPSLLCDAPATFALQPVPPPVRHESLLLSTADMEDILGRPLSPPATLPRKLLPQPSPPPASPRSARSSMSRPIPFLSCLLLLSLQLR